MSAGTITEDALHAEAQDYLWTLNFGPQHPATHTTLRLVLKLDGERWSMPCPTSAICTPASKRSASISNYNQYVTVTDRMNYISPMANNVAWHRAVEKLLGIELTPRCKYIRVIIAELSRISDHLLCNGAVGLDTGAFTYFLYAFNQREVIYDIFETLCGARFTNSYTRVGGLMYDMTPLVDREDPHFLQEFPKTLDDMERLLNRNRIFIDRTKGVGVLSTEEAINRSSSGPIARASGVTRDLRKDEPYLAYSDFDFKSAARKAGDCFARYLVRMGEMRESLQDRRAGDRESAQRAGQRRHRRARGVSRQGQVFSTIEGMISHFELADDQPRFRSAARRSVLGHRSPQRRTGLLPRRRRQRRGVPCPLPAAVVHPFALFPHLIRGHTLSDMVAVLGSLNIIAAELDR